MQKISKSGILVVFGASGDLTQRKLIPAICSIFQNAELSDNRVLLGVSRTRYTDQDFRYRVSQALANKVSDKKIIVQFTKKVYYQNISFDQEEDYEVLKSRIENLCKTTKVVSNVLFYLSTPPNLYYVIPENLARVGLNSEKEGYRRLVIEKPFGIDKKSSCNLNRHLLKDYSESQIFRIDHYLGKEMVQNIIAIRAFNPLFASVWNSNFIDNVQICANESIGVGLRSGYYDQNGAIRDMVQNHLLQLLGLVSMELPKNLDPNLIGLQIFKILNSVRIFKNKADIKNNVVVAQYSCSQNPNTKESYRNESGVSPCSLTETYVAIRFFIDTVNWAGVPFYLKTGKCLDNSSLSVVVTFRNNISTLPGQKKMHKNRLVIKIQPHESIKLSFYTKKLGTGFVAKDVDLSCDYENIIDFGKKISPYQRLILDALDGNNSLFVSSSTVDSCWKIVDPIIEIIRKENMKNFLHFYPAYSPGPKESDTMLSKLGHSWYDRVSPPIQL